MLIAVFLTGALYGYQFVRVSNESPTVITALVGQSTPDELLQLLSAQTPKSSLKVTALSKVGAIIGRKD